MAATRSARSASARGARAAARSAGAAGGAVVATTPSPPPAKRARGAPGAPGGDGGAAGAAAAGVNPYEAKRAARIAENRKRMAELNLARLGASLAAAPPPTAKKSTTSRGAARGKPARAPPTEVRRSGRVRGAKPIYAEGIRIERADGSVVLDNGTEVKKGGGSAAAEVAKQRPRGDLPFESTDAKGAIEAVPEDDARFVAALAAAATSGEPARPAHEGEVGPATASCGPLPLSAYARVSLEESDALRAAKVTTKAAVHVRFMPRSGARVVAVGDKAGNVGLWNYSAFQEGEEEEDAERHGVRMLQPHSSYISGLEWTQGGAKLVSCSYEGVVRTLDAETGVCVETFADEETEYSAMTLGADGSTIYCADKDGYLSAIDTRAGGYIFGGEESALQIASGKVNTIDVERGEGHLLASSTSGKAKDNSIWDLRALPGKRGATVKPIWTITLGSGCQSAVWAPDGSKRLLTTSWDNVLRVYAPTGASSKAKASGKKESTAAAAGWHESVRVRHNCNTGQYLVPFRAQFSPAGDGIMCGALRKNFMLWDAASAACVGSYDSALLSAVPSRCAFHPCMPHIAGATGSGRVHIFASDE